MALFLVCIETIWYRYTPYVQYMIKTLYANASAMVFFGNIFSPQFSVSRETRQGCPLSPILFILTLEPLAQAIRQHPLVLPITFLNMTHKFCFTPTTLFYM